MTTSEELKSRLLGEIKQEEWRKRIHNEEYESNSNLIKEISKKNLELVSRKNKTFKHTKYKAKQCPIPKTISVKARTAYTTWKEQNPRQKKPCPEVSVQNILLLVHYLNSGPDRNAKDELNNCLRRQNSEFDGFWDSPSYILKLLRKCVLTRDWTNMTYFLLILLNYDKKYLHVIKNMCQIMVKFNPLVKECGLQDQFNAFIHTSKDELVVV